METLRGGPKAYGSGPEIHANRGHFYFFAGVRGNYPMLRGVKGALERRYGTNITVYNSAFLAERPTADRYQNMSASIAGHVKEGPVTIQTHSYGFVEALRALTEDPNLLAQRKDAEKITLVAISHVLPRNIGDILKQLGTFGELWVQEGRGFRWVLPGKSSILSGIASANALPTDKMSRQEWAEAARLASPKLSYLSGRMMEENFDHRDYSSLLVEGKWKRLQAIDSKVKGALEDGKRWRVRRLMRKRGRITKNDIFPILDGKRADQLREPQITGVTVGSRKESRSLRRRLFMDGVRGKELERLGKILDAGVKVVFINPEQDLMKSRETADVSIPFTTHVIPWTLQPDILPAINDFVNTLK